MLTLEQRWVLVGIGSMIYLFTFAPLLLTALVRRRPRESRRWLLNVVVTVFIAWSVISVYRLFVEVPVEVAYAQSKGDFMADGVGGNVAIILFAGWLFPLAECLLVWAFFAIAGHRKKNA